MWPLTARPASRRTQCNTADSDQQKREVGQDVEQVRDAQPFSRIGERVVSEALVEWPERQQSAQNRDEDESERRDAPRSGSWDRGQPTTIGGGHVRAPATCR